jgi:hypothetical protein
MSYHTILVDLCANELVDPRLGVARSLALRFDAALVGMHVVPPRAKAKPTGTTGRGNYR